MILFVYTHILQQRKKKSAEYMVMHMSLTSCGDHTNIIQSIFFCPPNLNQQIHTRLFVLLIDELVVQTRADFTFFIYLSSIEKREEEFNLA